MAAATGTDPIAFWALGIAVVAALGSVGQALWVRGQMKTQREALDLQRKALDAQGESLAEQRAALNQAKELWERSGANIVISGQRKVDDFDRRSDSYSFRIRNVGRMGTTIHEVFLDDLVIAGFGKLSLDPWIALPRSLNDGEEVTFGFCALSWDGPSILGHGDVAMPGVRRSALAAKLETLTNP